MDNRFLSAFDPLIFIEKTVAEDRIQDTFGGQEMELPLENVKVLDMSRMLPGPYCTWLLADMGAEVTRIEQPSEIAKGDKAHNITSVDSRQRRRIRAYDLFTRNKKSVLMDLKKEEAREIIYKLAEKSDIFVEDYRPGAMERFGLDYEQYQEGQSADNLLFYFSLRSGWSLPAQSGS